VRTLELLQCSLFELEILTGQKGQTDWWGQSMLNAAEV